MDKIINIFLLLIIFVFDPLAIALVISANFAFSKPQLSTKNELVVEGSVPDGAEFNKPYPILEDEDFITLENYIADDISPLNEMHRSEIDWLQSNISASLPNEVDLKKNIPVKPKRSGGYWF